MIGLCCLLPAIYYYLTGKAWLAVFILFFLMTAGFQMIPVRLMTMPSMGVSKVYDWVLLFAGAIFLIRPQIFAKLYVWRHFKLLAIYGSFLLVALIYSIFVTEIEVPVAIRVFRNFIFFISLFLFLPLSLQDFEKIWRLVIYFTTIASVFYCLQPFTHIGFLNMVISDLASMAYNPVRFYNVPVFICPVLFFLFFQKHTFNIRFRNILLAINILAVLLTQHRNLMITVLLCFFLFLVMNKRLKLGNAVVYCMLGAGILFAADDFMDKRLSKGMEDLGNVSVARQAAQFHSVSLSDLSTTEFRKLLFMERLRYVWKDETRCFFGIGLITDDSKKAKRLRFYIGAPDDDGNISQVANIDIAWAGMLLQLGILGTVIFILLHLFLFNNFFSKRQDAHMQTGIFYLVSLFITSIYGSVIAMPYTMCMTMLFTAYYFKITYGRYEAEMI
jgi:hypothetical protein